MLAHAYAPNAAPPPRLYAQYTWVKELGLSWDDLGGIDTEDIGMLVECLNIQRQAEEVKAKVAQGGKKGA